MNYKLKENHLKKNLDKPGSWYIHFNFLFLTLGFITAPIDDALNYGKVNERTQPTGHGHRPATAAQPQPQHTALCGLWNSCNTQL